MNHNFYARYKNVLLRPLSHDDIESLRVWRNDMQATRFLRQIGYITPEMQEKWYQSYLNNPNEFTFAIVETAELNRIVGSVSIYDISGRQAEFGRIQIGDKAAHGKGIGRISMVMALAVGFDKLGLQKITGCVHQKNIAAHSNDMKIGFKITGKQDSAVGGYEDIIEIDRETLFAVNSYANEIELGVFNSES